MARAKNKAYNESTIQQGGQMFQKYIVPAIGVGAFILGGIIAREKAFEVVDILKKATSDTSSS